MKKLSLFIFALILTLTSCQEKRTSESDGVHSLPSATLAVPTPMIPTSTLLAVQTMSVDSSSITKCLNLSNGSSVDISLSGRLIIGSDNPHTIHILDLRTKAQVPFDNGQGSNIQVSPDRNWIAYIKTDSTTNNEILIVQSADGSKTYKFPTQPEEWQSISRWFDNEKLMLWNHTAPLDNIILFSPFDGAKEVMPTEYPNILPVDDDWDFYWPSITLYSPSLAELLYVAKEGDSFKPGYSKLVLWNLVDRQAVTEIKEFGLSVVPPLWNSVGDGALYVKSIEGYDPPVAHDELFFLSSTGETKQITHLRDYFEYARVLNYSLSPDEKYLAIILETRQKEGKEPKQELLILDMLSLQLKDLCLSPDRFTPLIWSSDNYKLALSQTSQTGVPTTIVVDIVNENVYKIVENFKPRGWLR